MDEDDKDFINLEEGPKEGGLADHAEFRRQMRESELRGDKYTAEQKEAIIDKVWKLRSGGLNQKELKKGIRELKEEGTINSLEEKKLRKNLGI